MVKHNFTYLWCKQNIQNLKGIFKFTRYIQSVVLAWSYTVALSLLNMNRSVWECCQSQLLYRCEEGTCKMCICCPGLKHKNTLSSADSYPSHDGPPENVLERDGLSCGEDIRNVSLVKPAYAVSFPGLTGKTEQV